MDPCSDHKREGAKNHLFGLEMDQMNEQWKTEQ